MLIMDTVVDQVRKLAATADEAGRKKLLDSLRNLSHAIETPYDTLQRFAGLVSQMKQMNLTTKGDGADHYLCSIFKSRLLVLALT